MEKDINDILTRFNITSDSKVDVNGLIQYLKGVKLVYSNITGDSDHISLLSDPDYVIKITDEFYVSIFEELHNDLLLKDDNHGKVF